MINGVFLLSSASGMELFSLVFNKSLSVDPLNFCAMHFALFKTSNEQLLTYHKQNKTYFIFKTEAKDITFIKYLNTENHDALVVLVFSGWVPLSCLEMSKLCIMKVLIK